MIVQKGGYFKIQYLYILYFFTNTICTEPASIGLPLSIYIVISFCYTWSMFVMYRILKFLHVDYDVTCFCCLEKEHTNQ